MSDGGTFQERMDVLSGLVPKTSLHGRLEVNQVYARYQDGWGDPYVEGAPVVTPTQISHGPGGKPPGPSFDHPLGGEAGYLSQTLTRRGSMYTEELCAAIDDEVPLKDVMKGIVEDLANAVFDLAPREFWPLRLSAHPSVKVDDVVEYDRPPLTPRLSQEELDMMRVSATHYTIHPEPRHVSSSAVGKKMTKLAGGG